MTKVNYNELNYFHDQETELHNSSEHDHDSLLAKVIKLRREKDKWRSYVSSQNYFQQKSDKDLKNMVNMIHRNFGDMSTKAGDDEDFPTKQNEFEYITNLTQAYRMRHGSKALKPMNSTNFDTVKTGNMGPSNRSVENKRSDNNIKLETEYNPYERNNNIDGYDDEVNESKYLKTEASPNFISDPNIQKTQGNEQDQANILTNNDRHNDRRQSLGEKKKHPTLHNKSASGIIKMPGNLSKWKIGNLDSSNFTRKPKTNIALVKDFKKLMIGKGEPVTTTTDNRSKEISKTLSSGDFSKKNLFFKNNQLTTEPSTKTNINFNKNIFNKEMASTAYQVK